MEGKLFEKLFFEIVEERQFLDMILTHKHHIIPRHMGGSDESSNIVVLSIEEHAEEHRKLWSQYGKWQDYLAYCALSKQVSVAEITHLKRVLANRGKIVLESTREKLRAANTGKRASEETKKKMSQNNGMKNAAIAKSHSEKMKIKMRGNKNGLGGKSSSGMIKINNGIDEKFIHPDESLPFGWVKGRLPRIWINDGKTERWILVSEIQHFQDWNKGRLIKVIYNPSFSKEDH